MREFYGVPYIRVAYWCNGDWCYAEDSDGNFIPMNALAVFIDVPYSTTHESITELVNYEAMCLRRKRDWELAQAQC